MRQKLLEEINTRAFAFCREHGVHPLAMVHLAMLEGAVLAIGASTDNMRRLAREIKTLRIENNKPH